MALANDVRELAIRTLEALNASHDYYVCTKRVWRLMRQTVRAGRKLTLKNHLTGTVIDERALVDRSRHYVNNYLRASSFQHFVSLFEDFYFDLLRLWLAAYPGSLAKKSLEFSTVLKAPDRSAIVLNVVDKEINELKYERVADWFANLERLAKLGCPTENEIAQLAEMKATRDILVHNRGIVNAAYLDKSGARARFKAGEKLELPEPYHRASWETIKKIMQDVSEAAIKKTQGNA